MLALTRNVHAEKRSQMVSPAECMPRGLRPKDQPIDDPRMGWQMLRAMATVEQK